MPGRSPPGPALPAARLRKPVFRPTTRASQPAAASSRTCCKPPTGSARRTAIAPAARYLSPVSGRHWPRASAPRCRDWELLGTACVDGKKPGRNRCHDWGHARPGWRQSRIIGAGRAGGMKANIVNDEGDLSDRCCAAGAYPDEQVLRQRIPQNLEILLITEKYFLSASPPAPAPPSPHPGKTGTRTTICRRTTIIQVSQP